MPPPPPPQQDRQPLQLLPLPPQLPPLMPPLRRRGSGPPVEDRFLPALPLPALLSSLPLLVAQPLWTALLPLSVPLLPMLPLPAPPLSPQRATPSPALPLPPPPAVAETPEPASSWPVAAGTSWTP